MRWVAVAYGKQLAGILRNTANFSRPLGAIWTLLFLMGIVVAAEVVALITVAANHPTIAAFWLVLTAIGIMLTGLAAMATYHLAKPLKVPGLELPLFGGIVVAAASISVWLIA
jgi:hypothetical protein